MKKHLFLKTLLIAIGLLITSLTTQTWAAWYVRGDSPLSWDNGASMTQSSANSAVYYLQVSGSRTFKIVNAYSGWDCTIIGAGNKASDNTYGNVSLTGSDNISSTQTGTWYICYHTTDDVIYGTTTNPNYPDMVIAGNDWGDPAIGDWSTTATQMTNNGDGTYSKTITGVTTTAHQFKITYKGTWTGAKGYDAEKVSGVNCAPSGSSGNIQFTPAAAGDVTITYNQSTGNIVITCPSPSVTINLNNQGGSSSPSSVTANLSSPMPTLASTPTYAGKKFEGYYTEANGGGTQYYYYNGTSAHTCDLANNSTLYANWKTPRTVTLYYAVSAATVATNTVKCNINFGYDQGWNAYNMTKTDKTYGGKVIYSVEVTANYDSFDKIYFWPFGSAENQREAVSTYTNANSIGGKMFVDGSSAGTWITYAEDEPYTVYYVNTGDWTTPCAYAWSSETDKSCDYASSEPMTNTGFTYAGKDIYSITYSKGYDKVIFNDDSSDETKTDDLYCYSNRGQIYNGTTWHAYGRDVYIYAIPEDSHYGYKTAFDPETHELRANVKVGNTGDGEWLGDWPIFSKTSFKYNGNWIYVARVLAKYNVICRIQFWEYSGGSAVSGDSYYDCDSGSEYAASDINGKIFGGWVDETHKWYDFGWDVELDRQGGTTGSESITATQGAAMPAITAPGGKTGYSFGGYFTEEGGSGTQYYAANGSSAANWDESDATTLFAKWTQNITLDREGATSGSTSLAATYNATLNLGSYTAPEKVGYDFAGYWTGDNGTGAMVINAAGEVQIVASWTDGDKKWIHDGASTLHAKWTPVALTTKAAGNWNDSENWDPECVPTIDHDVTIAHQISVDGSAVAKSVNITTGKVTIPSAGVLEVQGAITSDSNEKLHIETTSSSQGALIFGSGSPHATVEMSLSNTNYHYIAIPTGGVSVSSTFFGENVYTFVWHEGTGWERRGYYDNIMGYEPMAVAGITGCTFYGILSNTGGGGALAFTSGKTYEGTNMIPNTLTAPIRIGSLSFSGSIDDAVKIWNGGAWESYANGSAGEYVIPAMQSYVVLASTTGSVSFTYDEAVRGASNKNAPLKAPKQVHSDLLDHMTIFVATNERKVKLALYENEQFTNEIDKGYESVYLEGDGTLGQLYAQAKKKMDILATPDLEGTVLGFAPGQTENYTISFEGDGRGYYLNDMKEEEATLIEEGNTYVFTPDESTNSTRFVISKTPIAKTPTSVENISDSSKAGKQMIDGTLYIIRDGRIYNAEGSLVK